MTDELRVIQCEHKITCAPIEWHTEFAGIPMPGGPRVTCTCGDSVQIEFYGAHVISKLNVGLLEHVVAKHSDDAAKHDMELVCTQCDEVLCDIEDGDTLTVLVSMATDHTEDCTVVSTRP